MLVLLFIVSALNAICKLFEDIQDLMTKQKNRVNRDHQIFGYRPSLCNWISE